MGKGLSDTRWGEFYLKDIFNEIQRGKRLKKEHHKLGKVPYISSTSMSNGVDGFVGNKEGLHGVCIRSLVRGVDDSDN